MAISINWTTRVITIPKSFMSEISATLYELDINGLRLALKDIEDNEEGMGFLDTHRHNTQVVLSGVTYARTLEIINGYTITFENGNYRVRCVGANHNLADVMSLNYVSLIVGNAAGLIVSGGSGGATPAEIWAHGTRTLTSFGSLVADMWSHTARTLTSFGSLIAGIWNYMGRTLSSGTKDAEIDSLLEKVSGMEAVDFGNWKIQGSQMIFYKGIDSEELMRFNLYDKNGNLTEDMLKVFERRRA